MIGVVASWVGAAWRGVLALTWPVDCLGCGIPVVEPGVCAECGLLLEVRDGPRCRRCDADLPVPGPERTCGRCLGRPPVFERAWGRFDYAGPVGEAIRAGKYRGRPDALPFVARLLEAHVPDALRERPPDLVVPVPLHPRRLAQRGVHAPLLLARAVGRALDVPVASRRLVRTRDTPAQAGLDDRARRRNVRRAFAVRGEVAGREVLLVDDVMTTGATVDEAARTLRRADAAGVRVLAAALVSREG